MLHSSPTPPTPSVLQNLHQVAQQQGMVDVAGNLETIYNFMEAELLQVEAGLQHFCRAQSHPFETDLASAKAYLLQSGGKRIRPLCVLLAARLGELTPSPPQALDIALAAELVHSATLLHDDVIDDAASRRGRAAVRVVYSNSLSILAGDHLLVQALQRVQQTGEHKILADLLEVIGRMVAAEALQLSGRNRVALQRDVYLQVIEGKTASLFAWGLAAGGNLAGLSSSQVTHLQHIGTHLGMAFQLVDDVMDFNGQPQITGKGVLADIREGKFTWPVILATEQDQDVYALVQALAQEGADHEALCAQLVEAIQTSTVLQQTREFAKTQVHQAIGKLQHIPLSRARTALQGVIELTLTRLF